MADEVPLVSMVGISKRYGGAQACAGVDFVVRAAKVHALLGENGAGKSTLMKILSGEVTDYEGQVAIAGEPVRFDGPAAAQRAGIAMIHQELDLVPNMSVADNVFLGREPRTRQGTLDRRRVTRQTRELLDRIGVALDPGLTVGDLRTGERQLVTIASALLRDPRVVIMDEPTSALSQPEVERLFQVINELRRDGVGVVYISHRMDEIGRIADHATVLRNGHVVREFDARSMSAAQAAEAMVGRPVQTMFRTDTESGDSDVGAEILRVRDLVVRPRRARSGRREPNGIMLTVRRGEIVGLTGLLGSGRTELLQTLFGAGSPGRWSGTVELDGRRIRPRGPRQALALGVAFVPEDRRVDGLALDHSIRANAVLSVLGRLSRFGVVSRRVEMRTTGESTRQLKVKSSSPREAVGGLSGGNQQKVLLGRMLLTRPKLLLLDEPTRGVDVGAKAEIYQLLGEIARAGVGVLMASSELTELVGVCDRVVVLRNGRTAGELSTRHSGEADLLAAAMGDMDALTDEGREKSHG
ncbi:MAG: sugar ABC transporter ATP-binding protein [Kutzneria sp.]|nr:sugar ABC transporter ATP-binding protein [Kutzneria sp.]